MSLPRLRTVTNFREVGGYRTRDGRRVRSDRLFRSGHLGGASEDDLGQLSRLGIRTVIDFRVAADLADDGQSRLPAGARRINIPMHDPARGGDIRELLYRADADGLEQLLGGGGAERLMCEAAAGLVTERCVEFGAFLRALAGEETLPALMHCSAGKDRTGWAASLLLLALGASEEDAIAHYLLSNEHRREENERLLASPREGMRAEWMLPFLEVRESYARASLDAACDRFGSFDAYVSEGLGVDAATLARLCELFLE